MCSGSKMTDLIKEKLAAAEAELAQTQELQQRAAQSLQAAAQQILLLQGRIATLKELLDG